MANISDSAGIFTGVTLELFNEVERVLQNRGVGLEVTRTESSRRSK